MLGPRRARLYVYVIDEGFELELGKAHERSAGSKLGEVAVEGVHRALAAELPPMERFGFRARSC